MMPDDDLTFAQLCKFVGASPTTVKKRIREHGLSPRVVGKIKFFTKQQAKRIKAAQAKHGGRWPGRKAFADG